MSEKTVKALKLTKQTVKNLQVRTGVRTGETVLSVDFCPEPEPSPFSRPVSRPIENH